MTNVDPLGIPAESTTAEGGPVLVLADFDRLGRMWSAWALVDEQGSVLGASTDCEGVIAYEGSSLSQARGIVAGHCDV